MEKKKEIKTKLRKEGDFIPPDGGWGWMIVFAAGFSNLAALPTLQQFGLLFRDRFRDLGITSSECTTIINMNSALQSFVGLANGPVFKTFSYRQVSLTGAVVVFVSLLCTTFSYNFTTYLISFSILYGVGFGISGSANALALNTYWKERRRLATAFSWTTTGLGPILWPQIITLLFAYFGELGTILLLAGFSLHSIFCALLLHPVEWHSKQPTKNNEEARLMDTEINKTQLIASDVKNESGYFSTKLKNLSAFSSQYLYNEDDPQNPGYEITDPGIPMMVRANDGYFSQSRQSKSRISSREGSNRGSRLPSKKPSMTNLLENRSRKSSTLYLNESKKNSYANLAALPSQDRDNVTYKSKSQSKRKKSITDVQIPESEIEDCPTLKAPQDLKAEEKAVVETIGPEKAKIILDKAEQHLAGSKSMKSFKLEPQYGEKYNKDNKSNISYKNMEDFEDKKYLKDNHSNQSYRTTRKVSMFFDLDLLKDFTFVNLMLGMTLACFNELNFSILTPFILGDFGLTQQQVAFFMSLLAGVDISVRFCIPFIAGKVGWENSSFFLFGVLCMAMGRVVLAYCQNYCVVLLVAVIIGFGKGLRTVFMALVIPTHVPLHKLPGASGIQLVTAGIVYVSLGPVVGYIKDNAETEVTLHCLNIFTWLTALSWGLEKYIRRKRQGDSTEEIVKA
ncbi:major facilitator superfamily domain-containing protein [Phthorimaea operculella]|nr:major facilitator superfamily domain-containing protein [Phthorimaea operculella]